MGSEVRFDDDARGALLRGMDAYAHAVRVTLGPCGHLIALGGEAAPRFTSDPDAIAAELRLPDPGEDLGVRLLTATSARVVAECGDGAATTAVLAHRLVRGALVAVASGADPAHFAEGLAHAAERSAHALEALARPLREGELARVVALACGDAVVGARVAEAFAAVGDDGVVTVVDGPTQGVTLEVVDGVRLGHGLASPFLAGEGEDGACTLDHPLVWLHDGVLTRPGEVVPALEAAATQRRPLLVVCGGITTEALAVLVVNRLRGTAAGVAVCLEDEDERAARLVDLAHMTGATVTGGEALPATAVRAAQLGRAAYACVDGVQALVLRGGGDLAAWRGAMDSHARDAASGVEGAAERLAFLRSRVAVLRVADVAARSVVRRGLAAARGALGQGVVPGAGMALMHAAQAVAVGRGAWDVTLAEALAAPARAIAQRAGISHAELDRMRAGDPWRGPDAGTGRVVALEAHGLVDAADVALAALREAVALTVTVLTTDALVVEETPGG